MPARRTSGRPASDATAASTSSDSQRHGARTSVRSVGRTDRSPRAQPRAQPGLGPGPFQPFDHVEQRQLARRERLVARGDERRRIGRRAAGRRVAPRHLAERQVFGEAPRRQVVGRAGEQREEGPAGRIRAPRAAREPGRHLGALERLFDRPPVALGRPDDDRHLVERHAAGRFVEDPARHLDRLARFARRREEPHAVVLDAGRRLAGEEEAADAGQRVGPGVVAHLDRRGERRRQQRQRPRVTGRNRGEHRCRPRDQGLDERLLGDGRDRHVDEDDRPCRQAARVAGAEARGRRVEERRRDRRARPPPAARRSDRRDGRGRVPPRRGPPGAPARRRPRAARPACRPGRAAGRGCRQSGPGSRASRLGSARRGRGWPAHRWPARWPASRPDAASVAVAIREASWPRVKRCRPKVAPRLAATPRQKSSAASRVAPTTISSVDAGQPATNADGGLEPHAGRRRHDRERCHSSVTLPQKNAGPGGRGRTSPPRGGRTVG